MSFGFGAPASTGGNAPAELGPELRDVFTDEVGFKGLAGDANIRLLPSPWPSNALPAPTSSLLAVAHSKGVIVGAGPDSLAVASTDTVRKAIAAPAGEGNAKTRPFEPQAKIPLPARPTHVAFTANDDALLLATENGSQISVFETSSLAQGNAQPALSALSSFPIDMQIPGRRHDNDFAEISRVLILPTHQEIVSSDSEYLPSTNFL